MFSKLLVAAGLAEEVPDNTPTPTSGPAAQPELPPRQTVQLPTTVPANIAAQVPVAQPIVAQTPVAQPQFVGFGIPVGIDPELEQKVISGLDAAMLEASAPGSYTYLNYVKSLAELAKTLPMVPEDQRMTIVNSTIAGLGVTPADIAASGQHFLNVLNNEETKFKDRLNVRFHNEVEVLEGEASRIDAAIAERQQKIQAIVDEMEQMAKKRAEMVGQAAENKGKLDAYVRTFDHVKGEFVTRISGIVSKLSVQQ